MNTTLASEEQNDLSQTIGILISAGLSVAGSTFIIVSYIIWSDIRTTTRKLLVFLSLTDFLNSVGNAAGVACAKWCGAGQMDTDTMNCLFQSIVTTFASLASFFWTVCIAIFLYITFVHGDVTKAKSLVKVFHLLSWGVPLAITSAAVACDALGNDESLDSSGWCWVRRHPRYPSFAVSLDSDGGSPHPGNDTGMDDFSNTSAMAKIVDDTRARTFWLLMAGKGWEILAYILTVGLYVAIKCHIYSESHHGRLHFLTTSVLKTAQQVDRKLIFIPLLFVLLRIWGTARTMLDIFDTDYSPHKWYHMSTLRTLHGIGDNAQGFANFLIFCWFSPKMRSRMRPDCSWCPRAKKLSEESQSLLQSSSSPLAINSSADDTKMKKDRRLLSHWNVSPDSKQQ